MLSQPKVQEGFIVKRDPCQDYYNIIFKHIRHWAIHMHACYTLHLNKLTCKWSGWRLGRPRKLMSKIKTHLTVTTVNLLMIESLVLSIQLMHANSPWSTIDCHQPIIVWCLQQLKELSYWDYHRPILSINLAIRDNIILASHTFNLQHTIHTISANYELNAWCFTNLQLLCMCHLKWKLIHSNIPLVYAMLGNVVQ